MDRTVARTKKQKQKFIKMFSDAIMKSKGARLLGAKNEIIDYTNNQGWLQAIPSPIAQITIELKVR